MRLTELEIEPDIFGNSRRAKRRARLRAKADVVRRNAVPTVDPDTGRISQQGTITMTPPQQPDTEPAPTVQRNPGPTPKPRRPSGVIIRRSRNFDNF